jgi:O-antigen biosynthesis protein WbqP
MDIFVSFVGLLALSPLFAALFIAVRLTSPGPAFFRQRRVGRNKKIFSLLKFRTMRTDAPKDMPTHLLLDPYAHITPIGRFLRKTSLDELPQLINILVGQMSVVGPRPALWNQYDLVAERERRGANAVRPGLTGLAQINGRDELPIETKAAYDGEYIKRMGFLLDCKIFFGTALYVAKSKGVKEGAKTPSVSAMPEYVPEEAASNQPEPSLSEKMPV